MTHLNLKENLIQEFLQKANNSFCFGIVELLDLLSFGLAGKSVDKELKKLESYVVKELEVQTFYNKIIWEMESDGSLSGIAVGDSILCNCKININKNCISKTGKSFLNINLKKHVYRNNIEDKIKKELVYAFSYEAVKMADFLDMAYAKSRLSRN